MVDLPYGEWPEARYHRKEESNTRGEPNQRKPTMVEGAPGTVKGAKEAPHAPQQLKPPIINAFNANFVTFEVG